jgi:aminodeoxyfutalosine deaminase
MNWQPVDPEVPRLAPELRTFIRQLPKVELHLHLEGSLRPPLMRELAARHGHGSAEVERWIREREQSGYRYGNFQRFIEAFKFAMMLLEEPQDYGFAAERLFEELASQEVRYAEVTISAGVVLWRKQPLDHVFEEVEKAALAARNRWGIRVQWIFDAVRQFDAGPALEVVKWARRFQNRGVVGFGIGGDERQGPARLFVDVYREARESGLRLTAHAGETAGAESVADAVNLLGAERIGHGLAAATDDQVMAMLAARQIPLEVCITSNVSTGVLEKFEDHPLRRFLRAGVRLTLNSDDPGLFGAQLQEEMNLAAIHFALSREELLQFCGNAIQCSFLPGEEKRALEGELETASNARQQGETRAST